MNALEYPGHDLIIVETAPGTKVLDLGCGDGKLLERLREQKQVTPYGVEITEAGVWKCVEKGLYCYQGDIDEGLSDYKENSFDYVILNQTLQITKRPAYVIREMMRISRNAIVSFPNFGYFKTRLQLMIKGRMPVNILLPFEWYETPNIHHLTIRDFRDFCEKNGYPVKKERHFSITYRGETRISSFHPNMFAQYGFFILNGEGFAE
jgi:methionine biosynthesis protein MetW